MKKITIMLILSLMVLSACTTQVIMPSDATEYNTLSVQGVEEFEASPDLAKLRLGLTTRSKDPQVAQEENRRLANAIQDALKSAGARSNDIETTNYNINRRSEWDQELRRQVDRGYEVTNTVVVSTKDLDIVGELIDAAVRAGANNVQGISFELSDVKEREVKVQALRRAAQNAREKATALAQGAQVKLKGVKSVKENSFNVQPYYKSMDSRVMSMAVEESSPTPIAPKSVNVRASVSVIFEVA